MVVNPKSVPRLFYAIKAVFPSSPEPHRRYLFAVIKPPRPKFFHPPFPPKPSRNETTPRHPLSLRPPTLQNFGQIWTNVKIQPEYQTPEQRRALNKRLHAFIMKQLVTVGVPKAAVVLFSLIQQAKPR